MATVTTKLGLRLDDPADQYDVVVVNGNLTKLENAAGLLIVDNAAARAALPASVKWQGREVMDRDTQNTYVWDVGTAQWIRTNYWAAYVPPATGVVNIGTTGASISTNVSAGRTFRAAITANVSLLAPTNPVDGELVTWEITASGAARTITPVTTAGGFRFGSTITSWSQIASGLTDIMRAKYHAPSGLWRVLDLVKGF